MNIIIRYDGCFIAITDSIEAESHKHCFLQLFLSSEKPLPIEVKHIRIPCNAIIVSTNTVHRFHSAGEPGFTMLVDPTTELGRRFKGLLANQPFLYFLKKKPPSCGKD